MVKFQILPTVYQLGLAGLVPPVVSHWGIRKCDMARKITPGTSKLLTRTVRGMQGQKPVNTTEYFGPHAFEGERIQDIVKGDRKGEFPYYSEKRRIAIDVPRSVHTRFLNDKGQLFHDYVTTSSIYPEEYIILTLVDYGPVNAGIDNCVSESITKALNDLDDNSAQFGASVAEGRATVDMFASNAAKLAQAIYAAKVGNYKRIPDILGLSRKEILSGQFAANRWLEYQYGWKPLMSDVRQLQSKAHEVFLKDYFIKGEGKSSTTHSYGWNSNFRDYKMDTRYSCKTILKAKISRPELRAIQSWGLINPVSIAWELVPFSFVIDWFAPVGNTLQAATAGLGLSFVGGSSFGKREFSFEKKGNSRPEFGESIISRGLQVAEGYEVNREVYSSFPRARFYADTTPFSTPRVANAAALLRLLL